MLVERALAIRQDPLEPLGARTLGCEPLIEVVPLQRDDAPVVPGRSDF